MAKKQTPEISNVTEGQGVVAGTKRLAYFYDEKGVRIVLHTAEKKGEIGPADLIEEVSLAVADFPAEFKNGDGLMTLASYGLCKLVQDRTSQVAGCAEKFAAMVKEAQRLIDTGEWRAAVVRAEGTTRAGSRKVDALVAKAVGELKGLSLPAAEAALKKLDKDSYDKLCKSEKVQELVQKYKAEAGAEAGAETDLADLLG